MANNFCRFLGNQYRFDLSGIAPCCYYTKKIDFFDPKKFQDLHNKLINQRTWTEECSYCKNREDLNLESPRQSSLKYPELFGLNAPDEPDELTSLEIQTDTDCNGACLICGPSHSTTWQKYEAKFNPDIKIFENNKVGISARFDRIKEIFDLSKLKKIGFANGGEPLKSDTHLQFLRELSSLGNLKDVRISYVSNGSIKPNDETVALWKVAKEVQLNISIDGIDEQFEYLRWPLKFSQIKDNLEYILNLDIKGKFTFSYAITPFNAYYHDRYEDWSKDFFKHYGEQYNNIQIIKPFSHPFRAGGVINMSCVPPKLRFAILKKYGPDHQISRLIESFDLKKYQEFIGYIEMHDRRRNLNFRSVFPEIESYFSESLKNLT